ncbi:MAG: HAD family hydrolase [Trueperaceae bacterium]|nr:HAD family hydrolase [Trueperaceae bacterium]
MPLPWTEIPPGPHDVGLVVCDMDGTLLTSDDQIPASFWPLLEVLRERAATFVPASGRQYATLVRSFADAPGDIAYVAENGNLVVHGGEVVSKTTVDARLVGRVVAATRRTEADLGLVLCGVESAYVERRDAFFVNEAHKYYARLEVVDDLTRVDDEALKLAIYVFGPAEPLARTTFAPLAEGYQLVVSGANWIDIMARDVNKGQAVRALQAALGVPPERTAVFADYLNDLEMLDAARWSFAMANAHPQVRERAAYLAPSNDEHGVVTVLRHLLGV